MIGLSNANIHVHNNSNFWEYSCKIKKIDHLFIESKYMFAIYIHLLFDLNNKRRGYSEKSMMHVLTILFQEIEKNYNNSINAMDSSIL
jgi:hypothetical protein